MASCGPIGWFAQTSAPLRSSGRSSVRINWRGCEPTGNGGHFSSRRWPNPSVSKASCCPSALTPPPTGHIDCIVPDSRGFIWFCTPEGLSRFDGYRIVSFGIAEGLPDGVIESFFETRSGAYLVGTRRKSSPVSCGRRRRRVHGLPSGSRPRRQSGPRTVRISITMISRIVMDRWANENPAWPRAVGAIGFANMFDGGMENGALMLRIPEFKIGSLVVKEAAAVSRPDGTFEKWMSGMMTAPIVGSVAGNVLRDFRVAIDCKDGLAYFERSGDSSDVDLVSIGLVLSGRPGGALVVTGVSSNAGVDVRNCVRTGDKAIAVDGVRLVTRNRTAIEAGRRNRLARTVRRSMLLGLGLGG